jgi:hypothetical protein
VIYWVTYILNVVSEEILVNCVKNLLPEASAQDILNKLYCLSRISGWINKIAADRDYYHATVDQDPFDYSYNAAARERDTVRRKTDIALELTTVERAPQTVFARAMTGRRAKPR